MIESGRPLALAAAISLTLGVGVATAQTVVLKNAAAGSTLEVVVNSTPAGTVKVDASGIATQGVNLFTDVKKTETDAQIFIDLCENDVRRVIITERAHTPPTQEAGCTRRDMGGWFLLRRVSSLLVDLGGPSPTLLLRQGKVNLNPARLWTPPTGLVVFGGGAYTKIRDQRLIACGNVAPCGGNDDGFSFHGGATFWLNPYLAAEAAYIRPAEVNADGTGNTFRFNSEFESNVFTVVGKGGIPWGHARLYGLVGGTYHRAKRTTTNTITNLTPNETQTLELRTGGWGWVLGGGVEVWLTPAVAIFGEADTAGLNGSSRDDDEGFIDDRLTAILFGVRVKIF
jgi:hypothetical protein